MNLRTTVPLLIGVMILVFLVIQPRIFGAVAMQQVEGDTDYIEVLVAPGDTVWGLAREYGPDGVDVRRMIYQIRDANGLETFVIHPGQVLIIPIAK